MLDPPPDALRRLQLWLPAVLLALTLMSHLVVAMFAVYAARRALGAAPAAPLVDARAPRSSWSAGLLTAVWSLPLGGDRSATRPTCGTSRASARLRYLDWMFLSEMWFLYPLALVAIGAGICVPPAGDARRSCGDHWSPTGLVLLGWERLRDIFGKAPAWNLRLLPFWYLCCSCSRRSGRPSSCGWSRQRRVGGARIGTRRAARRRVCPPPTARSSTAGVAIPPTRSTSAVAEATAPRAAAGADPPRRATRVRVVAHRR